VNSFGVVILAAGASSRMGRPKLLLPWGETTIIGHLISQWHDLGAAQMTVVMRPHDVLLTEELNRLHVTKPDRIINPQPERGMFSSVITASQWDGWGDDISRWAIVLGDQPHLQSTTLEALIGFSALNLDAICQPAFGGRTAHPVILPRPVFESLKQTKAATLKEFLKLSDSRSVQQIINDPGLALDLDTPEDYKQMRGSILSYERKTGA